MSRLDKHTALRTKETLAAICREVETLRASADRLCEIIARSEGFFEVEEKSKIGERKKILAYGNNSLIGSA